MERNLLYLFVMLLALSCVEPNPGPDGFLPYSLPSYNGMDEATLLEMDEKIQEQTFGDLHSVIVIRNGKILFEKYYGTYDRTDLHPMGAATQSIISTVYGVALKQGIINDLNGRLIDLFPQYPEYFSDIPQKDRISIRHLLSHSSGLWWDEWKTPFGNPENDAYAMTLSNSWVEYTLQKPMIREPGTTFNFNSGNAILLAPILEGLAGTDFGSYTDEQLFRRIGIENWEWDTTPDGHVNTAWGLHLRPMDFAKIGYLYLSNGVWQGDSLFFEIWPQRVAISRARVSGYYNYGLHWWTFTSQADAIGRLYVNDVFFAWGNSGQHLFIIPHLKMAVAVSSGTLENEHAVVEMMRDYIFPAIIDR